MCLSFAAKHSTFLIHQAEVLGLSRFCQVSQPSIWISPPQEEEQEDEGGARASTALAGMSVSFWCTV